MQNISSLSHIKELSNQSNKVPTQNMGKGFLVIREEVKLGVLFVGENHKARRCWEREPPRTREGCLRKEGSGLFQQMTDGGQNQLSKYWTYGEDLSLWDVNFWEGCEKGEV